MENKITLSVICASMMFTAMAKIVVTVPTQADKVYTGSPQKADVETCAEYTVFANPSRIDVGTSTVILMLNDTDNYVWSDGEEEVTTFTWNIVKASNEWLTAPSLADWTYGEAACTPQFEAKFGNNFVQITYSGDAKDGTHYDHVSSVVKAGDYTAHFSVPAPSSGNYEAIAETDVAFKINVATPGGGGGGGSGNVTVTPTTYNGQWDGNPHGASVALSGEDATSFDEVRYATAEEGPYDTNVKTFTEIGTHTVWYILSSVNYATVTNTLEVTITKKEIEPPMVASKVYSGTNLSPDCAESIDYTIEFCGSYSAAGTHENALILQLTDATHTKWSHTDEDVAIFSFTITKATDNVWLDPQPSITGWKYGEPANAPVATAKFGTSALTVKYNGQTTDGTLVEDATSVSKAGTYTAVFTIPESADYNGLTASVPFVIEKGDIDIGGSGGSGGAVLNVSNYKGAYDGCDHTATIAVSGDDRTSFDITYSLTEDGVYTPLIPVFKNVCWRTNVWFAISSPDYQSVTNFAVVTITNRPVTVASESVSKIYDGTPLAISNENIIVTSGLIGELPLPEGESFIFDNFAERTEVGSSPASFTIVAGSRTKLDNYAINCITGTIEIVAVPYTPVDVVFDALGGKIGDEVVVSKTMTDGVYSDIPQAVRNGYTLNGWFDGWTNGAVKVENGEVLRYTESHTLYAKWTSDSLDEGANAFPIRAKLPSVYAVPDRLVNATDGEPVYSIAEKQYAIIQSLTEVTTPLFCTNIGKQAFYRCASLKKLTLVTPRDYATLEKLPLTIGDEAFVGGNLHELTICEGVNVGSHAFSASFNLTNLTILGACSIETNWLSQCGVQKGGVRVHLTPELMTNSVFVTTLRQCANVTISNEPAGYVEYTHFKAEGGVLVSTFKTNRRVAINTVKALASSDVNFALEKVAALEPCEEPTYDSENDLWTVKFATPIGWVNCFIKLCILE